jgi:hypothetical protein
MQLRRFSEAAGRARQRDLRDQAINLRVATQAKDDGFNKHLKRLDGH